MKSIVDYTNKLKEFFASKQALTSTQNSIAPTEDGTNYSTSYSKGAQFYHNGVLRKVTASSVNTSSAIASTSAAVDSITEQIGEMFYWTSVEIEIYGNNNNNYATGSKDITVANYTPIFVGGVNVDRRNMSVYQAYLSGNTLYSSIYNIENQVIHTTDKTIVTVYILYKHN